VLDLANRAEETRQAVNEAIDLYSAKGDVVSAARSNAWAEARGQR
jgi:hypothetical protein